ncbi:hypothetical protein Mterra_01780 [Calidithermus terrae]|uniref:Uncharacterized protein n=1 Tax=Calidithermus terrae TaxID=1408545 RepID=A0A399EKS7_9DEIN|nr:hypothetical protein Mterra_01780 [Calidithermus terrae]
MGLEEGAVVALGLLQQPHPLGQEAHPVGCAAVARGGEVLQGEPVDLLAVALEGAGVGLAGSKQVAVERPHQAQVVQRGGVGAGAQAQRLQARLQRAGPVALEVEGPAQVGPGHAAAGQQLEGPREGPGGLVGPALVEGGEGALFPAVGDLGGVLAEPPGRRPPGGVLERLQHHHGGDALEGVALRELAGLGQGQRLAALLEVEHRPVGRQGLPRVERGPELDERLGQGLEAPLQLPALGERQRRLVLGFGRGEAGHALELPLGQPGEVGLLARVGPEGPRLEPQAGAQPAQGQQRLGEAGPGHLLGRGEEEHQLAPLPPPARQHPAGAGALERQPRPARGVQAAGHPLVAALPGQVREQHGRQRGRRHPQALGEGLGGGVPARPLERQHQPLRPRRGPPHQDQQPQGQTARHGPMLIPRAANTVTEVPPPRFSR